MDFFLFLLNIGFLRSIPGTAANTAIQAAESASASAEIAQQHSMGVSVSGHTITFIPATGS